MQVKEGFLEIGMHMDQGCRFHQFTLKNLLKAKFFGCKVYEKRYKMENLFSLQKA